MAFIVVGGIQAVDDITDIVNRKPLEAIRDTSIFAVSAYVASAVTTGCAAPALGADLPVCVALGVAAGAVTGWVAEWLLPHQ